MNGSSPGNKLTPVGHSFWFEILFTRPDRNFFRPQDQGVAPLNYHKVFVVVVRVHLGSSIDVAFPIGHLIFITRFFSQSMPS